MAACPSGKSVKFQTVGPCTKLLVSVIWAAIRFYIHCYCAAEKQMLVYMYFIDTDKRSPRTIVLKPVTVLYY